EPHVPEIVRRTLSPGCERSLTPTGVVPLLAVGVSITRARTPPDLLHGSARGPRGGPKTRDPVRQLPLRLQSNRNSAAGLSWRGNDPPLRSNGSGHVYSALKRAQICGRVRNGCCRRGTSKGRFPLRGFQVARR